jgi:hypothetical protein
MRLIRERDEPLENERKDREHFWRSSFLLTNERKDKCFFELSSKYDLYAHLQYFYMNYCQYEPSLL